MKNWSGGREGFEPEGGGITRMQEIEHKVTEELRVLEGEPFGGITNHKPRNSRDEGPDPAP